ncbi:hypothetical protein [Vulgatibacter sp.]|uniref:hypothetical protein n=1 Tax=Vulgatibacter sp. TaxID=1971226 RepID=UPI0035628E85
MRYVLLHVALGDVPEPLADRFYEELQRREWQRSSDLLACFYRPSAREDRIAIDEALRDAAAAGVEADTGDVECGIAFAEHPPLVEVVDPWRV